MSAIDVSPLVTAISEVAPVIAAVSVAILGIYVLIYAFRWVRETLEIRSAYNEELDQMQADADYYRDLNGR